MVFERQVKLGLVALFELFYIAFGDVDSLDTCAVSSGVFKLDGRTGEHLGWKSSNAGLVSVHQSDS